MKWEQFVEYFKDYYEVKEEHHGTRIRVLVFKSYGKTVLAATNYKYINFADPDHEFKGTSIRFESLEAMIPVVESVLRGVKV